MECLVHSSNKNNIILDDNWKVDPVIETNMDPHLLRLLGLMDDSLVQQGSNRIMYLHNIWYYSSLVFKKKTNLPITEEIGANNYE